MLKHRLLLGPCLIIALVAAVWLDEWLHTSQGVMPGVVPLPILLLVVVLVGSAGNCRGRGVVGLG